MASIKEKTLGDINEEILESGNILTGISQDELKCIQKFNECQEIVWWIRDTTKGWPSVGIFTLCFNSIMKNLSHENPILQM